MQPQLQDIGYKLDEPYALEKRLHCRNILKQIQSSANDRLGHRDDQGQQVHGHSAGQRSRPEIVDEPEVRSPRKAMAIANPALSEIAMKRSTSYGRGSSQENVPPPVAMPVVTSAGNNANSAPDQVAINIPYDGGDEEVQPPDCSNVHRKRKRSRMQRLWKRLSGGAASVEM